MRRVDRGRADQYGGFWTVDKSLAQANLFEQIIVSKWLPNKGGLEGGGKTRLKLDIMRDHGRRSQTKGRNNRKKSRTHRAGKTDFGDGINTFK